MKIGNTISAVTSPWGLSFDDAALGRMETFADMLVEKNKVMNLTAITEDDKVARLHFADCLYLLSCEDLKGKKIIDIGCGGGFPSLPLLCAQPDLDITGVDSTAKRIAFVDESARALGVGGQFVAARAEEYALKNREKFDFATARAVVSLNVLLELSLPMLKVGGKLLAMKGMNAQEDEQAAKALQVLGGKIVDIKTYSVGEEFPERRIVVVEKVRKTPDAYPRRFAKISAKPL